jgi:uncharacterized Zn-finger protein
MLKMTGRRIVKVIITEIIYAKTDCDSVQKETFSCSTCQQQFSNKGHLTRHTQSVHSMLKFKCDACKHSFSRSDGLKAHKCKTETRDFTPPLPQKSTLDKDIRELCASNISCVHQI